MNTRAWTLPRVFLQFKCYTSRLKTCRSQRQSHDSGSDGHKHKSFALLKNYISSFLSHKKRNREATRWWFEFGSDDRIPGHTEKSLNSASDSSVLTEVKMNF
jgi:hypothetical protein